MQYRKYVCYFICIVICLPTPIDNIMHIEVCGTIICNQQYFWVNLITYQPVHKIGFTHMIMNHFHKSDQRKVNVYISHITLRIIPYHAIQLMETLSNVYLTWSAKRGHIVFPNCQSCLLMFSIHDLQVLGL